MSSMIESLMGSLGGDNLGALMSAVGGDATDADVFLAQSPGAVAYLIEAGLLQPMSDDLLAEVEKLLEGAPEEVASPIRAEIAARHGAAPECGEVDHELGK